MDYGKYLDPNPGGIRKMAWHLINDEIRPAIKQGMPVQEAIDLVMGTPGGIHLRSMIGKSAPLAISRLLRKGIAPAVVGGSLLFGGHASASILDTSNTLRSEIASVESIYDRNATTRTNASNLLYETAVHESDLLKYSRQLGGGPAVSKFQIEPVTAKNIVSWAKNKPRARNLLATESGFTYKKLSEMSRNQLANYLVGNEKFAVAIARLKYASSPGKIPSTIGGRSRYWSKYYQGTNNPVKQGKYISDNRRMAEEVKASSLSRVMGKHIGGLKLEVKTPQQIWYTRIGHNIKSVAKKLAMR